MSFPISGFTAVPNPMMLSFLATQGFAIMYYGGAGWQFGKRKVSGMSNEQVNNMTPNEFLQQLHGEIKTAIPTMQQGMKDMTPLINTTITQFGAYIREAIKALPEAVGNIFQQSYQGADNPYGNITNVRLSQGSQQYQRDRELYAGGPSAESLYERDIKKQQERDRQQASLEADAIRRQKEEDRLRELHSISLAPPNLQTLHQRFARTSTQTLKIGVRDRIKLVQLFSTQLRTTPITIAKKTRRRTNPYNPIGKSKRAPPRYVTVTTRITNPALKTIKAKLKKAQQDVIDFQAYVKWRMRKKSSHN